MLVELGTAPVTVVPATQVVARPGLAATTRFAGNVSLNAIVVAAAEFGFVMVKVSVDVPGATIVLGVKDLLSIKGNRITTVADAGASRLKYEVAPGGIPGEKLIVPESFAALMPL
jgi:hypothetical protein